MSYPRYLPEGGRQVPPGDGSDSGAHQHHGHEARDIMGQLISDHQLERERQQELDERARKESARDAEALAGDLQPSGWLRRLVFRWRSGDRAR
jgi:hypothetical protein